MLDHLHWKTSGPFTRIGSLQARVDGRIAYATTSWASWMRIGGRRWLRAIYPDTAVDPAYQGRRIFSRSVSYRRRLVTEPHDLSLHERTSSVRQKAPLDRKGQSMLANRVTRRVSDPAPASVLGDTRTARAGAFRPRRWRRSARRSAATRRGALRRDALRPQDDHRFDSRFDELFEEAAADFDVINERSDEYLRWRYGDRRAGPFVVRSISDRDRLLGYAVSARLERKPTSPISSRSRAASMCSKRWSPTPSRSRIAAGASGVECWLSGGHPYRAALRRQGFFDSRLDVGVEFHPIAATAEDLRCLRDPHARLHFQMGDTDMV